VSGNTPIPLRSITLHSSNKYFYALDGMGRLYAITDAGSSGTQVEVYNINGSQIGLPVVITGLAGLLAFEDRVLAKSTNSSSVFVNEITTTGSVVNTRVIESSPSASPSPLYTALNECTNSNTIDTNGVGTNFIRCLYDNGPTEFLHSLTYSSGTYRSASFSLPVGSSTARALFGAGKVLVKPGGSSPILLCNTTPTPTISCSPTDLPDLDTNLKKYLKFNGLDVFYINSSGAIKVGNVFDPPSDLRITVSSPSGGNASLDLNKFAFSFRPPTAPPGCNTQIVYLSSRTASPRTYTLSTANTCVTRILKVFP
jgi:hypothetical protein